MAMNLTLDIDFEMADKVTVANLKDSYCRIGDEIDVLQAKVRNQSIEQYEIEDLQHSIKVRKAIRKVLRYFMNHNEAEAYFNG